MDEVTFVALRSARDRSLPLPRLMLPALQVNLAAGRPPTPTAGVGQDAPRRLPPCGSRVMADLRTRDAAFGRGRA